MQLSRERKLDLLRESLGRPAFEKRNSPEVVYLCPFCRHYKPKLSVNLETDWYNCWTCEAGKTRGRTLVGLLRGRVRNDLLLEYMDSLASPSARKDRGTIFGGVQRQPPPPSAVLRLPEEFESLSWDNMIDLDSQRYMNYLERRGATEEDILFYRLGICRTGQYAGRVVFPSFDERGDLNFFTGRRVSGDSGPPYMTCDASKDIIFNDCLIDWSMGVVVVEGPFDMLTVGRNAVPLQGKMLRPESKLFMKLVSSGVKVFLAMDSDARYDQLASAHVLWRYGVDVSLVGLGSWKDVNEMGRERFYEHLRAAEPYDWRSRIKLLCA